MIYAWHNYPPDRFPPLWRWMAQEITSGAISMPGVAFDQVVHKMPECAHWLRSNSVHRIAINNDIVQEALRIKGHLGIINDQYFGVGVDENDVLIIAAAATENLEMISNENRQQTLPQDMRRYKIPAVCAMESVGVPCIDFLEFINRSGEVFE